MKMETIISATCSGVVSKVAVKVGESINQGDLVACIEPKEDKKWYIIEINIKFNQFKKL